MLSTTQDASWEKYRDEKRTQRSEAEFCLKILHNGFVTIKCCKTHIQQFLLFVMLLSCGHRSLCESVTHSSRSCDLCRPQNNNITNCVGLYTVTKCSMILPGVCDVAVLLVNRLKENIFSSMYP